MSGVEGASARWGWAGSCPPPDTPPHPAPGGYPACQGPATTSCPTTMSHPCHPIPATPYVIRWSRCHHVRVLTSHTTSDTTSHPATVSCPCHHVPSQTSHPIGDTSSHPSHHVPSLSPHLIVTPCPIPATTSRLWTRRLLPPCPRLPCVPPSRIGPCPAHLVTSVRRAGRAWLVWASAGGSGAQWGVTGRGHPCPLPRAPQDWCPCTRLHVCERVFVCERGVGWECAGPHTHPAQRAAPSPGPPAGCRGQGDPAPAGGPQGGGPAEPALLEGAVPRPRVPTMSLLPPSPMISPVPARLFPGDSGSGVSWERPLRLGTTGWGGLHCPPACPGPTVPSLPVPSLSSLCPAQLCRCGTLSHPVLSPLSLLIPSCPPLSPLPHSPSLIPSLLSHSLPVPSVPIPAHTGTLGLSHPPDPPRSHGESLVPR